MKKFLFTWSLLMTFAAIGMAQKTQNSYTVTVYPLTVSTGAIGSALSSNSQFTANSYYRVDIYDGHANNPVAVWLSLAESFDFGSLIGSPGSYTFFAHANPSQDSKDLSASETASFYIHTWSGVDFSSPGFIKIKDAITANPTTQINSSNFALPY